MDLFANPGSERALLALEWISKQQNHTQRLYKKNTAEHNFYDLEGEKNHALKNGLIITRKARNTRKLFGDFDKKTSKNLLQKE